MPVLADQCIAACYTVSSMKGSFEAGDVVGRRRAGRRCVQHRILRSPRGGDATSNARARSGDDAAPFAVRGRPVVVSRRWDR